MLYRIAALDERGRIAEQSVVHALGWGPGQRLQRVRNSFAPAKYGFIL